MKQNRIRRIFSQHLKVIYIFGYSKLKRWNSWNSNLLKKPRLEKIIQPSPIKKHIEENVNSYRVIAHLTMLNT